MPVARHPQHDAGHVAAQHPRSAEDSTSESMACLRRLSRELGVRLLEHSRTTTVRGTSGAGTSKISGQVALAADDVLHDLHEMLFMSHNLIKAAIDLAHTSTASLVITKALRLVELTSMLCSAQLKRVSELDNMPACLSGSEHCERSTEEPLQQLRGPHAPQGPQQQQQASQQQQQQQQPHTLHAVGSEGDEISSSCDSCLEAQEQEEYPPAKGCCTRL